MNRISLFTKKMEHWDAKGSATAGYFGVEGEGGGKDRLKREKRIMENRRRRGGGKADCTFFFQKKISSGGAEKKTRAAGATKGTIVSLS